jgi:hypothetical protein
LFVSSVENAGATASKFLFAANGFCTVPSISSSSALSHCTYAGQRPKASFRTSTDFWYGAAVGPSSFIHSAAYSCDAGSRRSMMAYRADHELNCWSSPVNTPGCEPRDTSKVAASEKRAANRCVAWTA